MTVRDESRFAQLLRRVLPERELDSEARAQLDAEADAVNLSRARNWGVPALALHGFAMWATARVPAVTLAERLWQRDLLRIYGALQATAVVLLACVAVRRGFARAVADRVGLLGQLSTLIAYALIGVNAQRLHGSIGPYMAIAASSPFVFRTPTAWFIGAHLTSSAILLAGILALQTSPVMRTNNAFVVVMYAAFGVFLGSMHNRSLVKDVQNRRALGRFNAELESRVAAQTVELRNFAMRLDDVLEDERRRLAREFHDDLGQELTAMTFEVEALRAHSTTDRQRTGLERVTAAIERSHASLRAILESLRPRILDEEGLEAAIRWLVAHLCERARFACDVEIVLNEAVHPQVELATFRIAQECLTNVVRHARAERVTISLRADGAEVTLEIADDGVGRGPAEPGRGMAGMRERAMGVGGDLTIAPRAPRGTSVRARLPLKPSFPSPRPS